MAQFRRAEEFIRIKELIWPTMERIEQLQSGAGALTGVPSGFVDLDRYTAGFQRSDLIILAARPSMGKTALALNIVQHAAIEHNTRVAFFSLEMSKDQLVQRLLCSEGLVDAQRLRRGQLRDDDYPKLARAAGLLGTAPIWIDDSASLTPLAMRSKARRLKAEHDIALVIVDYLQLMQGPGDVENRQQEISYISRSLKALAKELDVPVVALSQLSRAPEQRGGEHRRRLLHLPAGVLRWPGRSQDEREHRRHRRGDRRQATQRPDGHREAALQEGIHALRQLHRARGSGQCLKASRSFVVPNAVRTSRSGVAAVTAAVRGIRSLRRRWGG